MSRGFLMSVYGHRYRGQYRQSSSGVLKQQDWHENKYYFSKKRKFFVRHVQERYFNPPQPLPAQLHPNKIIFPPFLLSLKPTLNRVFLENNILDNWSIISHDQSPPPHLRVFLHFQLVHVLVPFSGFFFKKTFCWSMPNNLFSHLSVNLICCL